MTTINSSLSIGLSGLNAQQLVMSVIGQNISNVNTPGYSQQQVNLESSFEIQTPDGPMGTGVKADGVSRIVDNYLNGQINDNLQQQGAAQAENQGLTQANEIFTDEASNNGLSAQMSQFWNAWQALANNPSGSAERTSLVSAGQTMATTIQQKYSSLQSIQSDMDTSISGAVTSVNSIASQISNYNSQIATMEAGGNSANDLLDQRDTLMNKLSGMINFTSSQDSLGRVTITLGDGNELVGTSPNGQLTTVTNASGYQDVAWSSDPSTPINSSITSGSISGWLNVRDNVVPGYENQLKTLSQQIIQNVNALQSSGTGLDGSTGNAFFTGNSASTIQVNPAIVSNVSLIAAAAGGDATDLISGDNTNAVAIAGLQNTLTMNGNSETFDTAYNSLVSNVGTDAKNASNNLDQQTTIGNQLTSQQQSVSGVSLDEQMTNLIQSQSAYSASAKVITTVDQMMATLVSMVQ